MSDIQIILFRQAGSISYQGNIQVIGPRQLVVTSGEVKVAMPDRETGLHLVCYPGEMHELYHDVVDLLAKNEDKSSFNFTPFKAVPVFDELANVIEQLKLKGSRKTLVNFMFTYCLGMDNQYFSNFLRYFLAHNHDMLTYIQEHFTEPWPVTRFAENLDVDVRKLNFIFYKNYGVSAKKWLLERRLTHARKLLVETDEKVTSIALDSGFSNHSHFTDSFKKRFQRSPKDIRTELV